jgi:hypothetical protein
MTSTVFKARPASRNVRLGAACAVLAVALSACVPIPIAQRNYVPSGSDVTVTRAHNSGCAFNETTRRGVTQAGNFKVYQSVRTENEDSPSAYAVYDVVVIEAAKDGRFSDVSVVPSRITLRESGRTLAARVQDKNVYTQQNGKARHTRFQIAFPAPSGLADTLTILSQAGAVRVGNAALPASSVRYDLNLSPAVYMFPCIPS